MKTSAMKRLSYYDTLKHKVTIYVPATENVDTPINNSTYVKSTIRLFSALFGGSSALQVQGGWLSENNKIVTENTTAIYSYCKGLNDDNLNQVLDYVEKLKRTLNQEAIGFEVDGQFYLI